MKPRRALALLTWTLAAALCALLLPFGDHGSVFAGSSTLEGRRRPTVGCQAKPDSYGPDEFWSRKARADGVPARAYYKLEEIDRVVQLFQPGMKVLDIGCWPGSWTLYAARKVGPTGRVLGIDLKAVDFPLPPNAKTRVEDAQHFKAAGVPQLDVVMSDMAPKTRGDQSVDNDDQAFLVEVAMRIADSKLRTGGFFVAKLFDGARKEEIWHMLKKRYEKCKVVRPQATRSQSNELYLVGMYKREYTTEAPVAWEPLEETPKERPKPKVRTNFNGW